MLSCLLIFDLSGGELFLIVLAIIVLFGPKQIPVIARTIGKVMYEVRTATNQIKQEVMAEARHVEEVVQPAGDLSSTPAKGNKIADKELNKTESADQPTVSTETGDGQQVKSDTPSDTQTKKIDS